MTKKKKSYKNRDEKKRIQKNDDN